MPKVPCALLKKADQIEPAHLRIIYKMIFHNGRVKKKNESKNPFNCYVLVGFTVRQFFTFYR